MRNKQLPFIVWRDDRPRFVPGHRERALGLKGQDLRHPDGRWFTKAEAEAFASARYKEILILRDKFRGVPVTHTKAAREAAREAQGYVYFLRVGERVKIGFSIDPFTRATELRTAISEPIICLAAIRATQKCERRVHELFSEYRLEGEWFVYGRKLARFLEGSVHMGRLAFEPPPNLAPHVYRSAAQAGPSQENAP